MINRDLRQATVKFNAGDFAGAETLCERMLKRAPRNPDALRLLGILRLQGGCAAEAIPLLRGALQGDSRNLAALDALAVALIMAADYSHAEQILRQLIAIGGASPIAEMRLGIALASQRKWDDAVRCFEAAALGVPDRPDIHYNLGNALIEQHRAREAIVCFDRVLSLDPKHAGAHNALGTALQDAGKVNEAIGAYRRALELDPGYALAYRNLGNALLEQGKLEEASRHIERAIALKPDYVKAHSNLGVVRHEQGRLDEAIRCYEQALALDAEFADAHYNLALARLVRQQFEHTWERYEQRLGCEGIRASIRKDVATVELFERLPRWQGPTADAGSDTIGIWAEQGIGDQILFSTLIPELIAADAHFIYEVDGRLLGAYEREFPGQQFVSLSDPPHAVLAQARHALLAGSLPGLFRTSRTDFARQPQRLLQALPQRVTHYRSRFAELGAGPKVALSWQSKREDRMGPRKSAPLAWFAPVLQLPGVHFVDVQYGDTQAERQESQRATGSRLLHFDDVDYFNDLEEVLAILEACDLLITTSNVTAHLAGALGKRTWLMFLADNPPFHYWTHDASYRSLWYPSVEIVTGTQLTDWNALISHTAQKLRRARDDSRR